MAAVTPEVLRRMAALAGYSWTDEELQAIAPAIERSLTLVEKLESLPLQEVEPGLYFRMG